MTRAEILSEIKRAEEDARALVATALEAKTRKISEARAQSKEIIKNSENEALQYYESELKAAREALKKEREKILEKGKAEAEEIKDRAKNNMNKAVKFILAEFERAVNA